MRACNHYTTAALKYVLTEMIEIGILRVVEVLQKYYCYPPEKLWN